MPIRRKSDQTPERDDNTPLSCPTRSNIWGSVLRWGSNDYVNGDGNDFHPGGRGLRSSSARLFHRLMFVGHGSRWSSRRLLTKPSDALRHGKHRDINAVVSTVYGWFRRTAAAAVIIDGKYRLVYRADCLLRRTLDVHFFKGGMYR